jgi:EpsI family protein
LPGNGWNIKHSSSQKIVAPDTSSGMIKANKLIVEKGAQKQIVLYWFQSRGRFIASEYMQKIYLVIDSITKRRTDGSFIRLTTPVGDGNQEKAIEDLKSFSTLLIPVLQEFIPS